MFEKVAYDKWSGRKLYHWLKFELNFRTHAGKKHLSLGNIYKILDNTFYYGEFEYPKGSGQWYQGKHEPIITKELYDEVQTQLKGNELKTRIDKEFAFTKLMTCGLCGSGISADEKYKKLKNGSFNTHIYYGCTKAKDKNCKCGYINENDLIKQLQDLVDKVELKENKVLKQLKSEVMRFKKFQLALRAESTDIKVSDKDIRSYVKFILKDGELDEKRKLLESFNSKLSLKQKRVSVISNHQYYD
jgi:site-specific DNA recombinase